MRPRKVEVDKSVDSNKRVGRSSNNSLEDSSHPRLQVSFFKGL